MFNSKWAWMSSYIKNFKVKTYTRGKTKYYSETQKTVIRLLHSRIFIFPWTRNSESSDSYLNIAAIGLWQREAEPESKTKQQKPIGKG